MLSMTTIKVDVVFVHTTFPMVASATSATLTAVTTGSTTTIAVTNVTVTVTATVTLHVPHVAVFVAAAIIIIDTRPVACSGVSVDWVSGNVYWTDATLGHIMVSRLDGRYHRILLSSAGQPKGVSADPTNRSVTSAVKKMGKTESAVW